MDQSNVIIIGAGIAGLACAIRCRLKGYEVAVYESAAQPGGKLAEVRQSGYRFDAGPSLFTLPQQVEELFVLANKKPENYFTYTPLSCICKYFYEDGTTIQAFQEVHAFAEEIEHQTGEPQQHIHAFLQKSKQLYDITSHVFLHRSLHRLQTYLKKDTLQSLVQVHKLNAFRSMHRENQRRFNDPRVVQLFDRYATYNGSNPYQAPATLNIIPHLEHNIGAFFPTKGMYDIPQSLYRLATELGVQFHFSQPVEEILIEQKRAVGVRVNGQQIRGDRVISNMDVVPTYRRLLPHQPAPERILTQPRSSSAIIFYWGMNRTFPELDLHNIFFSQDYEEEFEQLWDREAVSDDPTVYLYISSKHLAADAPAGGENWFCMVNAPADTGQDWDTLIDQTRTHIQQKLSRMLGVSIVDHLVCESILDPRTIASRTSSYQGALYGNSSNNPFAAFLRHPNFSRRIKGLYFCGGSVHPGGGIPLCLLSAKIVADLIPDVEKSD